MRNAKEERKNANHEWFKHDKGSFEKMWDKVSKRTRMEWETEVVLRSGKR